MFETTNKRTDICQGKKMGIIATPAPSFEENRNFNWINDSENFSEVKDEIAIVNSSKPGKKKLKFTLLTNNNQKLDTIFIVNVLPNPDVTVTLTNSVLSFSNKHIGDIISFKWKYNGVLIPEVTDSLIKNPKEGTYQVFVIDNNGCRGNSEIIHVN